MDGPGPRDGGRREESWRPRDGSGGSRNGKQPDAKTRAKAHAAGPKKPAAIDAKAKANVQELRSPESQKRLEQVRAIIIVPLYMDNPYRSCYCPSSPRRRRTYGRRCCAACN
jgi:hypothetical protein